MKKCSIIKTSINFIFIITAPSMILFGNEPATISQVIQLAVAPVFLLSGVGPILIVITNRLARIVDRYRELSHMRQKREYLAILSSIESEMRLLEKRARYIHWSVSACTTCALFVCIVIATLFFGAMFELTSSLMVSVLFIVAMLLLIIGLIYFLYEIKIATSRIDSVGDEQL